jgi:hypothetical protein
MRIANVADYTIDSADSGHPWWIRISSEGQTLPSLKWPEAKALGHALIIAADATREAEQRFIESCRKRELESE